MSNLEATDVSQEKTKAAASVAYYASRMEAAMIASKDAEQAFFMLQQIVDGDARRFSCISRQDREQLSAKVLDFAKGMLKSQQLNTSLALADFHLAETALKWLRKALTLLESVPEELSFTGKALKRGILRSLARAYYMGSSNNPENLKYARATIDDILDGDGSTSESNDELLQVRWMKLAIVKRCEDEEGIMQACYNLIDNVPLTEETVGDIIQEARGFTLQFALCSSVLQKLIHKALGAEEGYPFVDKILMTLLFVCSREAESTVALREVELACNSISDSTFQFSKISCIAVQSILWQRAEKLYSSKAWHEAAAWYLMGTHAAFHGVANATGTKCLRKAVLCFIECRELQKALDILHRCPKDEAATSYLVFLVRTFQGAEEEGGFMFLPFFIGLRWLKH